MLIVLIILRTICAQYTHYLRTIVQVLQAFANDFKLLLAVSLACINL